jgi:hypothetical protein
MKPICMPAVIATVALLVLAGCQAHGVAGMSIELDAKNWLLVEAEGAQTIHTRMVISAPEEAIHRVLTNGDGKVLFAYDVSVGKRGEEGSYRLTLQPAQQKPTFAAAREVTFKAPEDSVRVELMERPGTGEKIVDVFSVVQRSTSPMAHLREMHNQLFRWVHSGH